MNVLILFGALLIIILYLILVLSRKKFKYWEKKNVPYVKPLPFLGNYGQYLLLQEYPGLLVQKLCKQFPEKPYIGAFFGTEPVLIVQDLELLKLILTKDFYYFHGREVTKYQDKELVTQNLFFSGGNRWKVVRQNLTPMFTSAKMRNMFHLVEKVCYLFEDVLDSETSITNIIDVKELSVRYTMDNICSCAFGVEANTLLKPENNPFSFIGKELFKATNYRGLMILFRAVWPAIFYKLGLKCFPEIIGVFFSDLLKGVFQARNYKPSARNDLVDLVLSLKNEDFISSDSITNTKTGLDEKVFLKVDDKLLMAQCIVFFAAGFETSSTLLSLTLFEFAKNPEVQQRAAEEIDEFLRRHDNRLNYDCVKELTYVAACANETMRLYPAVGVLTREVMDDYVLPDGLSLDKGVRIHIPVYYLHHNAKFFPDPETFKPERFLPGNKDKIKQFAYLPFGEGPRICIGKRFALMQVFAGLITFLKKYRVELADNMPETLELESRTFLIHPKGQGIMLKLYKREGWEQRTLERT